MQRKKMLDFLKKCKVVKSIPKDSVICVTRAESFDSETDKKVWKLEGNRSQVRDIDCSDCGHQVVMSNNAYRDYIKNQRANEVLCMECALKKMKHDQQN